MECNTAKKKLTRYAIARLCFSTLLYITELADARKKRKRDYTLEHERKKIIKRMKVQVGKIAKDHYGSMGEFEAKSSQVNEADNEEIKRDVELPLAEGNNDTVEGGKKDPSTRRKELLVDSGLSEVYCLFDSQNLVNVCIENAGELLISSIGKEVMYEVASGGVEGSSIRLWMKKIHVLHEAIASLVAIPKSEDENFHSSRTIRKLILDCPTLASTLWKKAAKGHSSKVICAFLECGDPKVRASAQTELQPLIDGGALKVPEPKQLTDDS